MIKINDDGICHEDTTYIKKFLSSSLLRKRRDFPQNWKTFFFFLFFLSFSLNKSHVCHVESKGNASNIAYTQYDMRKLIFHQKCILYHDWDGLREQFICKKEKIFTSFCLILCARARDVTYAYE